MDASILQPKRICLYMYFSLLYHLHLQCQQDLQRHHYHQHWIFFSISCRIRKLKFSFPALAGAITDYFNYASVRLAHSFYLSTVINSIIFVFLHLQHLRFFRLEISNFWVAVLAHQYSQLSALHFLWFWRIQVIWKWRKIDTTSGRAARLFCRSARFQYMGFGLRGLSCSGFSRYAQR